MDLLRYGPGVEDAGGSSGDRTSSAASEENKRGLRVLWAQFYGENYHPLYEEAVRRVRSKENRRYLALTSQTIFDIENYMKRTLLSVEIILLEANTRAEKQNTTAFLHVVGFGLGFHFSFNRFFLIIFLSFRSIFEIFFPNLFKVFQFSRDRRLENHPRSRDVLFQDLRNSPEENEPETEIRFRHYVRLLPPGQVRRSRKWRLSRRFLYF